jgi:hypothetical protein
LRTQKTVVTCDVCGKEIEEAVFDGLIRINANEEIRFDICSDDTEKLFGEIEASPRRGRTKQAA